MQKPCSDFRCGVAFILTKSIACFSAALIVSPGTLSPMDSFSSELGCDFSIRLEAPHVIDCERQVMCNYMPEFNLSFKFSDSAALHQRLGQLIIDVCSVTPNGVLVFCASYWWVETLVQTWRGNGQWGAIGVLKEVYVEPRLNDKGFGKLLKQFEASACTSRGALMIAVCRGKISEGLDLSDRCSPCCIYICIHILVVFGGKCFSHDASWQIQTITRRSCAWSAFSRRQRPLRHAEESIQQQVRSQLRNLRLFASFQRQAQPCFTDA